MSKGKEGTCVKSWFGGEEQGSSFKRIAFGVSLETHKTTSKEGNAISVNKGCHSHQRLQPSSVSR